MARRRPITYRHRSYAGCLRIVPRLEDLEKVAQNYEDLKVQNWRRWKWFFWLYTVFFPVVLLGASISAYARDYLREFFPSVGFACCWVIPSYLYHRYLESKCNKDREVVELLEEEQRQNEESEARRRIVEDAVSATQRRIVEDALSAHDNGTFELFKMRYDS